MFSSACIALSRRSDSWEGSEEKGARKMSTRGGLGVRIRNRGEREREIPSRFSPAPHLFSSLSLIRPTSNHLNAWNLLEPAVHRMK